MSDLVGGWSPYSTSLGDSLEVFNKALNGLVGVGYVPFAVSSQVIAGISYHFLCNATVMDAASTEYAVMIKITALVNSDPVITEIHKL